MQDPAPRPGETLAGRDPLVVVERLLRQAEGPLVAPADPHDALDAPGRRERALEALLREEPEDAAAHARAGLDAAGGGDPAVRLGLLRLLATAAAHARDAAGLERWTAERADLLRSLGRPRQAELEVQLGAALLREPDDFEATVLAGVVEDERARAAADPADTVLPDALLGLCAHRVQAADLDGALAAADEALAALERQRAAGAALGAGAEADVHLLRSRLHLWREETRAAEEAAVRALRLPGAAVVRASATLVRALAAHGEDRDDAALDFALRAAEQMARAGLRRGAASAAALVGRVAGHDPDRQDLSVAAWRLASVHAEKAEAPEAASLSYWWGHQLVAAGRAEEAEPVLEGLVRRQAAEGNEAERARALVDLGHALHEQDRPADALPHWREAADLFTGCGQHADAAHTLLAAGALTHRDRGDVARAGALGLFERAVEQARLAADEDPAVLASALHALGYLRCETGRGDGLALLDEAIALAERTGTPWQRADYLDTRARSLWALHQGDEAVSAALTSADMFHDAGDAQGAAQAELFAAYVVAEDGRPEQAATLFRLVHESTGSDLVRLGALTGLHQCLAALGEHEEAARVRRDADEVRRSLGVAED